MGNWDIEYALRRYAPLLPQNQADFPIKSTRVTSKEVTHERLDQCYKIAASAVKEYGDIYLPIFKRIHNEIEEFKTKKLLLNTAFKVANADNNN